MVHKVRTKQFALAAATAVILFGSSLALPVAAQSQITSEVRPPAGQKCPDGSYVIGFDAGANIICSKECGNSVLNTGEACDDGNTVSGDGCSATCQAEGANTVVSARKQTGGTPATGVTTTASIPDPVISDIEPSSVVFGSSNVTITVVGAGFDETSVIIFDGKSYETTVNSTGTQLVFNPETTHLTIGSYAITVSNDSGLKVTRKRALAIY